MKTALIIQIVPFEDLGYFTPLLMKTFDCHIIDAPTTDFTCINALSADLWVILGAPIGVYQEQAYPFLKTLKTQLATRLEADKPTLGICLGAQLIADVLGSKIYPSGHQEIGWKNIQLTEKGKQSPLKSLENQAVLHWHGDTFDLPQGAQHLASSDLCEQQAFQKGRTLALQFHPEVTTLGLERWLVAHTHEIHSLDLSVNELRADNQKYASKLQTAGSELLLNWLETVL